MGKKFHLIMLFMILVAVALLIPNDTLRVSRQGGGVGEIGDGKQGTDSYSKEFVEEVKNKGNLRMSKIRYLSMIATYKRMLSAAPDSQDVKNRLSKSYYELGMIERQLGNSVGAEDAFTESHKFESSGNPPK